MTVAHELLPGTLHMTERRVSDGIFCMEKVRQIVQYYRQIVTYYRQIVIHYGQIVKY